jgi:hypothetical protein
MVVTWKELGLGLLYGAWLSVEKCRALHDSIQDTVDPSSSLELCEAGRSSQQVTQGFSIGEQRWHVGMHKLVKVLFFGFPRVGG